MFDREQFDGLEPGDVVETQALMPGICKEPLTLEVIRRNANSISMEARFLGVRLGSVACAFNDAGHLLWSGEHVE